MKSTANARLSRSPVTEERMRPLDRRRRRVRHEVAGLGLVILGLAIFLSSLPQSGFIGPTLRTALRFLLGELGASLAALGLMGFGGLLVLRRQQVRPSSTSIGITALFAVFLGLHQMSAPGRGFLGREFGREPGGLVGTVVVELLRPAFGPILGSIVLTILGLCALAVMSEVPLATLAQRVARAAAVVVISGITRVSEKRRKRAQRRKLERGQAAKSPRPQLRALPAAERPQPSSAVQNPPLTAAGKAAPAPPRPSAKQLTFAEELGAAAATEPPKDLANYQLPPLSLLSSTPGGAKTDDALDKMELLEQTLASFGIEAKVVEIERGPRVTRYEVQPPPGVRVSRITNLADDLALSLAALDVRVEAPVPGKGVIGIEVPNSEVVFVDLKDILSSEVAQRTTSKLAFALGKDITGHPMMADLAKMPHLLIAGATNSGKSVCINAMVASILFRARPDEIKFLMVDPKRVELSLFEGIPHLVAPVAHDAKEAAGLLRWAIREMEHRYELFADHGVRNMVGFNELAVRDPELEPLYYLVIVIDELADLMMQAATEFETSICRLAQLARATGIHLVVATQRPSVNVITGTIKANISSRIAFAVASQVDSRTILDINGAERLVGSGDMLFLPIDASKPTRIQGAYISEADINRLVQYLRRQAAPSYQASALPAGERASWKEEEELEDGLFEKALEFVLSTKYASASMLQRKLRVGYTRAARLIDMMEERGYVGPADGSRPREVYSAPIGNEHAGSKGASRKGTDAQEEN